MTVLHRITKISSKISWQIRAISLIIFPGIIGFASTLILLKSPTKLKCTRIFLPVASISVKIYCAQIEAKENTLEGFLRAINLIKDFPKQHSLHSEIEYSVKKWTIAILDIAEEKFQQGQLQQAITIAERIPTNSQTHNIVVQRIKKWNNSWIESKKILAKVENELRDFNWNLAFKEVLTLLELPNKYWATTGYSNAIKKIRSAKEESSQLDNAFILLNRGGIDNWLTTINDSQKISVDSYAHYKAQSLIQDAKSKISNYINELIDTSNWSRLLKVIDKVSDKNIFTDEIKDWYIITNAGLDANKGTIESLKLAILTLKEIDSNSLLYQKSKDLADIWELDINYIAYIQKSRKLATQENIEDLKKAIKLIELIPPDNFYYQEAKQEIDQWNDLVQISEDKPILDKAKNLAKEDNILDLKRAITRIQSIGKDRALSPQANEEAKKWHINIQQKEDQLTLNQAIVLGNTKNYESAIIVAKRITLERPLYEKVQNYIKEWQIEIKAKQDLKKAYLIAQSQTSESLVSAIFSIQNIPPSTDVDSQVKQSLKRWSFQLLSMAQDLADRSLLKEAIQLAKMIPKKSPAYNSAQAKILIWNNFLK